MLTFNLLPQVSIFSFLKSQSMALLFTLVRISHANHEDIRNLANTKYIQKNNSAFSILIYMHTKSISSTAKLTYEDEEAASNSQQTAFFGNEMQELGSSSKHYKLILSLDTSSLNALFKKRFFTFGNLSLYTWFIIIISLSKETGERPGLEEKRNHVIIYRYHIKTFQNPVLIIMLPKVWVHFSNVQILNFREDPDKQWQSAVTWRLLTSLSPHGLWQKPPDFQWMQTLTQKLVKPQCIYCICYSPHSVTALHGSRSSPAPKEITASSGVSSGRREHSNRKQGRRLFVFLCLKDTALQGGMHEHCYSAKPYI